MSTPAAANGDAVAVLFPGQGSQSVGMGKALYDALPAARLRFEEASDLLQKDFARLCFDSPDAELVRTDNAQPAMTLVSITAYEALESAGIAAAAVAGHSVGEYAALYAAGVLSFPDTMRLVHARGTAMRDAAERHPGGMVAVFGLDAVRLTEICAEIGNGDVEVANHNTPTQVVLTGRSEAVRSVAQAAKSRGAKLVVPLKVSGPWHSRFMTDAQPALRNVLAGCAIGAPRVPVIANVTAAPYSADPERIRQILVDQIVSPVLWAQSMAALVSSGYRTYVEAGPGRVLAGLMKDIARDVSVFSLQSTDVLATIRAAGAPRPQ